MENQPKLEQIPLIEELEESVPLEKIKVSPQEYERIMRSLDVKDRDIYELVERRIKAIGQDTQREYEAIIKSIEEEFNQATVSDREERDQIKKPASKNLSRLQQQR